MTGRSDTAKVALLVLEDKRVEDVVVASSLTVDVEASKARVNAEVVALNSVVEVMLPGVELPKEVKLLGNTVPDEKDAMDVVVGKMVTFVSVK